MVRLPSRMVLSMPTMVIPTVTITASAADDPWDAAVVRRAGKHDTPNEGESQEGLARRRLLFIAPLGASAPLVARIAPWRGNVLAAPMTKLVVATATLHSIYFKYYVSVLNYGINLSFLAFN